MSTNESLYNFSLFHYNCKFNIKTFIFVAKIFRFQLFIVASDAVKGKGKGKEKKGKEKMKFIDKAKKEKFVGNKNNEKYCICDQNGEEPSSGDNEHGMSTVADYGEDKNGINSITQESLTGLEGGETETENTTEDHSGDMVEENSGFNMTEEEPFSGDFSDEFSGNNQTQDGASKMEDSIGQIESLTLKKKGKGKQKEKKKKPPNKEKKAVEKKKPKEKVAKKKIEPKVIYNATSSDFYQFINLSMVF